MELPKFSYSMRSMYRSCPRKVFYKYVAGISPIAEDNPARAIGRTFHKILEHWRGGVSIRESYDLAMDGLRADLLSQRMEEDDIRLEEARLWAYALGYSNRFLGDLQYLGLWQIEMELEKDGEIGYVDAMFPKDGKVWVVEDKTRSAISDHREMVLKMDEQLLNYAILLKKHGYDLGGVYYRETLKTRSRPKKGETREDYFARIIDEYGEPSKFREIFVSFDPSQVEQYALERKLTDVIIRNSFKLPRELKWWSRNTESCVGLYGPCDYLLLCTNPSECKGLFKPSGKDPMDSGVFKSSLLGD